MSMQNFTIYYVKYCIMNADHAQSH